MNDLELKNLWRQQDAEPATATPDADVIARMKRKMRRFDRDIVWRDLRELAACGFIAWWFGSGMLDNPSPLTLAGDVVLVVAAIVIAAFLVSVRRADRRDSRRAASVEDSLRAELRKVSRQEWLLTHVLWWYVLPIYAGAVLHVLGKNDSAAFKWSFTLGYAAVCAAIWWANRYAARKHLRPLITEIEQTLANIACLEDATPHPEPES